SRHTNAVREQGERPLDARYVTRVRGAERERVQVGAGHISRLLDIEHAVVIVVVEVCRKHDRRLRVVETQGWLRAGAARDRKRREERPRRRVPSEGGSDGTATAWRPSQSDLKGQGPTTSSRNRRSAVGAMRLTRDASARTTLNSRALAFS